MTDSQLAVVAQAFSGDDSATAVDRKSLSGSRKIINRKIDIVKRVFSILSEAKHFVVSRTIDFPEQGLRLCKLDQVESLRQGINARRASLAELLTELDSEWANVKAEAKERLQELYSESDYFATPSLHFGIDLSFPAIKPDDRLLQLNPSFYAELQESITKKFTDAVAIAEAQAAEEMQKLLKHLLDKLSPGEDGTKKRIAQSSVDNILEAVQLFKLKTVGSNAELDEMVEKIGELAAGIDIKEVRKSAADGRAVVASKVSELLVKIDAMVEAQPVRAINMDDLEDE